MAGYRSTFGSCHGTMAAWKRGRLWQDHQRGAVAASLGVSVPVGCCKSATQRGSCDEFGSYPLVILR